MRRSYLPPLFGLFPRFDKPEVRGGKQHLVEKKWREEEEKKRERGVYGGLTLQNTTDFTPFSPLFLRLSLHHPRPKKKGGFDPGKEHTTRAHSHDG